MSDCGVCITNDFDGQADVWERQFRKARKPHECCECGKTIEAGQRYEYYSVLYDSSWSHHNTCPTCAEIAEAFCCDGRIFGNLWNDFWENDVWPSLTTACFDRLETAEAKAELQRRWIEWKFEK